MQLQYDEDVVEAAVFCRAAGRGHPVPSFQAARFHRERERLYAITDAEERNRRFFHLHLEWFREWGLEELLTRPLQEYSLLRLHVRTLVLRKARGPREEGAELYVNGSVRTGVISLRPERLASGTEAAGFLHHEFFHLQDMVDPAYGYEPELAISLASASQQRLTRERYGVLWDASIDGRLTRAGRPTAGTKELRWLEFDQAFAFWPESKREEVFAWAWHSPSPTHKQFREWVSDPRQLDSSAGPQPGGLCPLCRFPTFAWAQAMTLEERTLLAIRGEFPGWSPGQGVCGRCVEIYRRRQFSEAMSP